MAIFCLARDVDDLKKRLGNIVVAYTRDRKPVRASDLKAHGAMTVLLKEAMAPNLVQTLEGTPAFIHGGPFANIAHGCNSVVATTTALKLADYVVTEAGFGADLGAREIHRHQMPQGRPRARLRRASSPPSARSRCTAASRRRTSRRRTSRRSKPAWPTCSAMSRTCRNSACRPVVSINRFSADTDAEIALVQEKCKALGVEALMADHWARAARARPMWPGGRQGIAESGKSKLKFLYPDDMPLFEKIRTIAKEIYRAKDVAADKSVTRPARRPGRRWATASCRSASPRRSIQLLDQSRRQGRADRLHVIPVREVRLSAGAEFVVAICGEIMTMPGLPKVPAADSIDIGPDGKIVGLFVSEGSRAARAGADRCHRGAWRCARRFPSHRR